MCVDESEVEEVMVGVMRRAELAGKRWEEVYVVSLRGKR